MQDLASVRGLAPERSAPRRRSLWLPAIGVSVLVLVWAAIDLWAPRSADIRSFDPGEVARLETSMWRSYYDRQRLELFAELAELLREQYHLSLLGSMVAAQDAARAAFVFKQGGARSDYEQALPGLERFYAAIRRVSNVPFDAERAARLELEWWIVHREQSEEAPHELVNALALLQSEIYQVPVEQLTEHARLRAEAMTIRDQEASQGEVTERDWMRIQELLRASWGSLFAAIHPSR